MTDNTFDKYAAVPYPKKGSRWQYGDKVIVVIGTRTIVDWHYEDVADPFSVSAKTGDLSCFTGEGGRAKSFQPLPDKIEPGQTFTQKYDWGDEYEFFVYEVTDTHIFGKERDTADDTGDWYGESYKLDYFIGKWARK